MAPLEAGTILVGHRGGDVANTPKNLIRGG